MLPGKPYSILIVDDNPRFVDVLETLIRDVAGGAINSIDKAYNGIEGLSLIRLKLYDFIFMDIQMPLLNGIQVTRIADREFFRHGLNIIAISYHCEEEYLSEMIKAGAKKFLSKDQISHDTISEIFGIPCKPPLSTN